MSLTLILMRHAKSDWSSGALSDKERPLNARGHHDAPRMGAWMASKGLTPDAVLVSSAQRTFETWEAIKSALPQPGEALFDDRLYHASSETILERINEQGGCTVLLIGHNPGIADAAHRLVATPPQHARFFDYPTCATLVCQFDVDAWSDVQWDTGTTLAFLTPHDL